MKTLKFFLALPVLTITVIIFFSCSKNSDPTITPKTALDSVKSATVTGTWTFSTRTLTQVSTGKSASSSTCDQSVFAASGLFTNGNWLYSLAPPFKYVFVGNNQFTTTNTCASGTVVPALSKLTFAQNSDGSVNVTFDIGGGSSFTYQIKTADLNQNSIKAVFTSFTSGSKPINVTDQYGYKSLVTFNRSQ